MVIPSSWPDAGVCCAGAGRLGLDDCASDRAAADATATPMTTAPVVHIDLAQLLRDHIILKPVSAPMRRLL